MECGNTAALRAKMAADDAGEMSRDRAIARFGREAAEEIHETILEYGCWPVPQRGEIMNDCLDLDDYFDERAEFRALSDDLIALLTCHSDRMIEVRDAIKSRISDDLRKWVDDQQERISDRAEELARDWADAHWERA